ncbi:site-specific integrase [Bifidobacterium pseudolongum]|uniref:site-specific integrase n=1 Tax=Bifidobacterium pseudolongum TaxID=1694 RepID=UPI00101F8A8A|nr:tyrosine-type recombinase/integrase [Bifidobacterium pseudolongum]RYQ76023.1 Integrase [Bifidobacterium pseudolongum subsp. globosum]
MGRRTFGAVRRLPSGRFQASYIVRDERFYADITFGSRAEADKWLSTVHYSLVERQWINPHIANQTFATYTLAWFDDHIERVRPKTRDIYAGLIDQLLLPFLGDEPMSEITPSRVKQWLKEVRQYFEERQASGSMPTKSSTGESRRSQAYRLLHAIMAEAVRDEVIKTNPCVIVGASQKKAIERVPATLQELDTIADNMPPRYYALIHVAAWSGLRFSELAGLRRKDVVLTYSNDTGALVYRLNVDKQAYRVRGTLYEDADLKTEAGRRVIYLPSHVTDALTEHMAKFTPQDANAYVFGTRNGTPMSNNSIGKMFRKAREIAGRPDLRFHDLRHTGATMAAKAGATTKELMQRLGHSSMRAAMIYQHANEEDDRRLAARMDALAAQAISKGEE